MRIRIREIGFEKRLLSGEAPADILELGNQGEDRFARVTAPVRYRLTVYEAADQLVAEGEVSARVEFCCARCACYFPLTVFDRQFCVVREIPENDEFVDLTDDLRESILLHFPAYPVCREDCAGLCPQCGGSLETGPCGCQPPADDRWSALDGLQPDQSAKGGR